MTGFAYHNPAEAIAAWMKQLSAVEAESIRWQDAAGRVLAEPIVADRDSPPADVSAMDGYALGGDIPSSGPIPVAADQAIGAPPLAAVAGQAIKIVTGACVPTGSTSVIRREDVDESQRQSITLRINPSDLKPGANIRVRGENLKAGRTVVEAGTVITPSIVAALAAFGVAKPRVHRVVRVGVLSTGDELKSVEASPDPWQIRDSNGPTLRALLSAHRWLQLESSAHACDDPGTLVAQLQQMLNTCDVVLVTGGVSMGDRDHVPDAIRSVGGRVIFHKLPIRPGKPLLGAVGGEGQAIVGMPGNPVAVLCCAARFASVVLRHRGGVKAGNAARPLVTLTEAPTRPIPLWRFLPVRLIKDGLAEMMTYQGSGDMVAAARSDGFIETPPDLTSTGPFPFYRWEI